MGDIAHEGRDVRALAVCQDELVTRTLHQVLSGTFDIEFPSKAARWPDVPLMTRFATWPIPSGLILSQLTFLHVRHR